MRAILVGVALLFLGVIAKAGDAPTNAPSIELTGTNAVAFTQTGRFVLRQVTSEGGGVTETNDLYIPILERKGVLYMGADDVEKLVALKKRLAEYREKADELQKLGDSIKTDYIAIITNARPKINP